MNIKPSFQQVIEAVGQTQDGKKLSKKDEYSGFLITLILSNTEIKSGPVDNGEVDTEELSSNLRYAISEFTKALAAVEKFNQ